MKKRIIALLTTILSAIMIMTSAVGCKLITTDNDRDMNQVVATIDINGKEDILKRDLLTAYINYGYYYVQYYSYSADEALNLVLNGLVQNQIIVQCAVESFNNDETFVKHSENSKYTSNPLAVYLDGDEIVEVIYNVYTSINTSIDSYEEDENEIKSETYNGTTRAVPTDASNFSHEITVAEMDAKITAGTIVDTNSTSSRRSAFNSFCRLLKNNGLLGDYEGEIEQTDYFYSLVKSNLQAKIIEKYEDALELKARKSVTYDMLKEEYTKTLTEQKEWTKAEYESALSNLSAGEPIVYSGYGTYGFVYNLLLGVNDYQSAEISAIKEDNENMSDSEYDSIRAEILLDTSAVDKRSAWIYSGYDFDINTKLFLNDYAVAGDNSLPFNGDVKMINDKDGAITAELKVDGDNSYMEFIENEKALEDFTPEYLVTKLNKLYTNVDYTSDKSFFGYMDEYLDGIVEVLGDTDTNVIRNVKLSNVDKYEEKIRELLFAYSTDSDSSFNSYKGYLIKPEAEAGNSEEWVATFANAGRKLLENGNNGYMVVASDYGYHIMFFSAKYVVGTSYETLDAYLESLGIADGKIAYETMLNDWDDADENSFLYIFASSLADTVVTNLKNEEEGKLIYKYRYGENKDAVKVYENVYADLLEE